MFVHDNVLLNYRTSWKSLLEWSKSINDPRLLLGELSLEIRAGGDFKIWIFWFLVYRSSIFSTSESLFLSIIFTLERQTERTHVFSMIQIIVSLMLHHNVILQSAQKFIMLPLWASNFDSLFLTFSAVFLKVRRSIHLFEIFRWFIEKKYRQALL